MKIFLSQNKHIPCAAFAAALCACLLLFSSVARAAEDKESVTGAELKGANRFRQSIEGKTGGEDESPSPLLVRRPFDNIGPLESRLMEDAGVGEGEGLFQEAGYVLGPGDTVSLQVWGKYSFSGLFQVSFSGVLTPTKFESESDYIGIPAWFEDIEATGKTLGELETALHALLEKQLAAKFWLSISLYEARTLRIQTLGNVAAPRNYHFHSTVTAEKAILLAGGILENGSIRRIRIQNAKGQLQRSVDLYPYFALGDVSQDLTLKSDDVIFVPGRQNQIQLLGGVANPGAYEFLEGETLGDMLNFAGGLTPDAAPKVAYIERLTDNGQKLHVKIPFSQASPPGDVALKNGDLVFIPNISLTRENITLILPNNTQFLLPIVEGKPLLDYYEEISGFLGSVDLSKLTLLRQTAEGVKAIDIDMEKLLQNGDQSQNVVFLPGDRLFFSDLQNVVHVVGEVRDPKSVPYTKTKNPMDYISLAGGPSADATLKNITIVSKRDDGSTSAREIDLSANFKRNASYEGEAIQPGDLIIVNERPERLIKRVTGLVSQIVPYIYLFK